MLQKIKKFVSWFYHFITHDIWHIRIEDLPKAKSVLIRLLRIIVLAFKGFKEDECKLRASALTYYSMMSIVPIAAMAFAIAKGFGFEKLLEERISGGFSGEGEVVNKIIGFANTLIENTRGGLIAGVGLVILLWAIMEVLSHVEESFNEIWEQKESRSFMRKFSDYFSIMLLAPILIIVSSSATAFISTTVYSMENKYAFIGYVGPVISFVLQCSPFILSWFLFTVVYIVMPNTKVKFKSAFIGGFIAGTVYQLTQMGYFIIQVELIDINAVYGSFAALPLLFLWIRISWVALLMGAEISYAHQNVHKFHYDMDVSRISARYKRTLSLLITHLLVKNFSEGEKPYTDDEISQHLAVPVRVIRQILYELIECRIVSELRTQNEKVLAYQPATDIHLITIQYVVEKLDDRGEMEIKLHPTQSYKEITESMKVFGETLKNSPANRLLMDI